MNKYLEELKTITDEIRKKDPSERTYRDRYYLWYERMMTSSPDASYDIGEEIEIYDGQKLAENKIKSGFGEDYPEWFRQMGLHFGEKCSTIDRHIYTLKGMSETFEDYYYILEDENGDRTYESCVTKLHFL